MEKISIKDFEKDITQNLPEGVKFEGKDEDGLNTFSFDDIDMRDVWFMELGNQQVIEGIKRGQILEVTMND